MIVEPVVSVILHCSRCNTPWLDGETETPAYWPGLADISESFRKAFGADVGGWRRTPNERYLCEGCHVLDGDLVVEKPPLPAIDEAKTWRAQDGYAKQYGKAIAYELLPEPAGEASR